MDATDEAIVAAATKMTSQCHVVAVQIRPLGIEAQADGSDIHAPSPARMT